MIQEEIKIVEFVCSGNSGRSPLAQGFGKKFILEHQVKGYEIISSGTRVKEIIEYRAMRIPAPEKEVLWAIDKGLERHLFSDEDEIRKLLRTGLSDPGVADTIHHYAQKTMERFTREEVAYKIEAFEQFGLGEPKIANDQTVVVPRAVLILGMQRNHVESIQGIYRPTVYNPDIETLEGFAGLRVTEFETAFARTVQEYLSMAVRIRECVYKSLDKLILHAA